MTPRQKGWLLPPSAVCLTAGILLGRSSASPLFIFTACLLSTVSFIFLKGRLRMAACLSIVLSIGALTGFWAYHPSLPEEGDYLVRGIVTDELKAGRFGQFSTRISHVSLDGRSFSGSLYWSFYTDENEELPSALEPGCFVTFRASLYHPSGEDNPEGYDFREELLRSGMIAAVSGHTDLHAEPPPFFSLPGVTARLRHRLSDGLTAALGEEAGGYAAAMLLGFRSMVSSEDRSAFARLGIAHLLSVSGFHVGILAAMLWFLLRRFSLSRKWMLAVVSIVLFAYALLCGMNQPVLRATLLILAGLLGHILQRPRSRLHLLCATYILLLLFSPVQLTGVSFQLTYGALLGIILVFPVLRRLFTPSGRITGWIWESFCVTLAAQIGVLLPELAVYQRLPILSCLTNLPAVLAGSGLIFLYWLILFLLPFPALAGAAGLPVAGLTAAFSGAVRTLARYPFFSLWTPAPSWLTVFGVLLLFFSLCALFRFRSQFRIVGSLLGLLLVIGSLIPTWHAGTEYIQFSSGNADAAVLWDRDRVLVVDTGENNGIVSSWLRRRRLTPDAVIVTHLHADHAGGLLSLLNDSIPVPVLYLPEGAEDQLIHEDMRALLDKLRESGTEFRTLSRGDSISLPSGSLRVLWPEKSMVRKNQDANQYSLVSLVELYGTRLFLASDLVGPYEMYTALPADILKAAHHGSPSSSSPEFLSAVSPQVILLTCSRASRAESFSARTGTVPVFATAFCGAVTVRFEENGFQVIPYLSNPSGGVSP